MTRPRDIESSAPDDAVLIYDPTMPEVDDFYTSGNPIYWPDEIDSWDMALVLATLEEVELDFGDAPTAAQSGFVNDYPTTLADDGARHVIVEGSPYFFDIPNAGPAGFPDADYCVANPGQVGYCAPSDCTVDPNSCPAGYQCCNFSMAGIPNFCATDADMNLLAGMCE